jgi:uncharacterized protein YaaN involved in tellurite resistance
MADPLSVVASVIALAGAAQKITQGISYLRKLGEIPNRVYVLRNEITDLKVVLSELGNALRESSIDADDHILRNTLSDVKKKLTEITSAIQRIGDACDRNKPKPMKSRAVWMKEKGNLDKLYHEIHALRESLSSILGLTTL